MADQNNAITGEDVRMVFFVDNARIGLIDQVTNLDIREVKQTVETRHIGTTEREIDRIPEGWQGTMDISAKRADLDNVIDAYNAARRARTPIEVVVSVTKFFKDGSSITHTYPDVDWEMEESIQRGQVVTRRVTWDCGTDRIAS